MENYRWQRPAYANRNIKLHLFNVETGWSICKEWYQKDIYFTDGGITEFEKNNLCKNCLRKVAQLLRDGKMNWNKFTMRKATKEEKSELGVEEIWNLPLPDDEEKVLVSDGENVWIDEWRSDNHEAFLIDRDAEGLYWMSFPELPKEMKGTKS